MGTPSGSGHARNYIPHARFARIENCDTKHYLAYSVTRNASHSTANRGHKLGQPRHTHLSGKHTSRMPLLRQSRSETQSSARPATHHKCQGEWFFSCLLFCPCSAGKKETHQKYLLQLLVRTDAGKGVWLHICQYLYLHLLHQLTLLIAE